MALLMADSRLNGAERDLQRSFRNSTHFFNGLLMAAAVVLAHLSIRELPGRRLLQPATVSLAYTPVSMAAAGAPLRLAGAWVMKAEDRRFGGVSALAIDGNRFLAVTDRGAVLSFDPPGMRQPTVWLADLRAGPGPFGNKWGRDAESLARDPRGRGWWVGYEQNHSLWLYDSSFSGARGSVDLGRDDWSFNKGAEGLVAGRDDLLVLAENGSDAMRIGPEGVGHLALSAGAEVADAAIAPDGSAWLLLRSKGLRGISQSIAPLLPADGGFRAGPAWPVPKGAFDNYEGMAVEARPGGGWRFWLISDDGHRVMARTLLAALDFTPARHGKGPAQRTGPSKKPAEKTL